MHSDVRVRTTRRLREIPGALTTLLTVGAELSSVIQLSGLTRAVASAPLGVGVAWLVGLTLRGDIH